VLGFTVNAEKVCQVPHTAVQDERGNKNNDFSVAEYLNKALELRDSTDESLQQRMAELALQLQLQTQSCHDDIGRIGAELQAVLPRCAADVSRLNVGLQGLQVDAESLLWSSATLEATADVSTSLETLSTLHALQANLVRTKEILSAAATWDATHKSVAGYLSQQNLAEAVHCLSILEKGEKALRGMPDPKSRVAAIQKVQTQVRTLLQPQLQHALAVLQTRVGPLQQCVELYTQLNQIESLVAEYVKHRPAALHKLWFDSYTPSVPGAEGEGDSFTTWLPGWLDSVLSLVSEEKRQCTTIFGPERVSEIVVKVRYLPLAFDSAFSSHFLSSDSMSD
jgi:Golgi complex component 7 (COG7)